MDAPRRGKNRDKGTDQQPYGPSQQGPSKWYSRAKQGLIRRATRRSADQSEQMSNDSTLPAAEETGPTPTRSLLVLLAVLVALVSTGVAFRGRIPSIGILQGGQEAVNGFDWAQSSDLDTQGLWQACSRIVNLPDVKLPDVQPSSDAVPDASIYSPDPLDALSLDCGSTADAEACQLAVSSNSYEEEPAPLDPAELLAELQANVYTRDPLNVLTLDCSNAPDAKTCRLAANSNFHEPLDSADAPSELQDPHSSQLQSDLAQLEVDCAANPEACQQVAEASNSYEDTAAVDVADNADYVVMSADGTSSSGADAASHIEPASNRSVLEQDQLSGPVLQLGPGQTALQRLQLWELTQAQQSGGVQPAIYAYAGLPHEAPAEQLKQQQEQQQQQYWEEVSDGPGQTSGQRQQQWSVAEGWTWPASTALAETEEYVGPGMTAMQQLQLWEAGLQGTADSEAPEGLQSEETALHGQQQLQQEHRQDVLGSGAGQTALQRLLQWEQQESESAAAASPNSYEGTEHPWLQKRIAEDSGAQWLDSSLWDLDCSIVGDDVVAAECERAKAVNRYEYEPANAQATEASEEQPQGPDPMGLDWMYLDTTADEETIQIQEHVVDQATSAVNVGTDTDAISDKELQLLEQRLQQIARTGRVTGYDIPAIADADLAWQAAGSSQASNSASNGGSSGKGSAAATAATSASAVHAATGLASSKKKEGGCEQDRKYYKNPCNNPAAQEQLSKQQQRKHHMYYKDPANALAQLVASTTAGLGAGGPFVNALLASPHTTVAVGIALAAVVAGTWYLIANGFDRDIKQDNKAQHVQEEGVSGSAPETSLVPGVSIDLEHDHAQGHGLTAGETIVPNNDLPLVTSPSDVPAKDPTMESNVSVVPAVDKGKERHAHLGDITPQPLSGSNSPRRSGTPVRSRSGTPVRGGSGTPNRDRSQRRFSYSLTTRSDQE